MWDDVAEVVGVDVAVEPDVPPAMLDLMARSVACSKCGTVRVIPAHKAAAFAKPDRKKKFVCADAQAVCPTGLARGRGRGKGKGKGRS